MIFSKLRRHATAVTKQFPIWPRYWSGSSGLISDPIMPSVLTRILSDALDRPIAFHRVFVQLTGSITAALMLSQAMYWSKRTTGSNDGSFYKTREQWEEETGLSRYEQESSRKILRKFPFWKEELRGVPAQMYYRVDIDALANELFTIAKSGLSCQKMKKNARLLKTSQLDGGKAANKKAENHPSSRLDTNQHYKGISEITTETTTTTANAPTEIEPRSDIACSEKDKVRCHDSIRKILEKTLISAADPARIAGAADKYNRSEDEVAMTVDILDQQYRRSKRSVEDPTALVIAALIDGVVPPEGYLAKKQREAEAEKRRKAAVQRQEKEIRLREIEEKAFREAEARLSGLSDRERDDLFAAAAQKLPSELQKYTWAVKALAINLMIAQVRAPDGSDNNAHTPR